MKYWKSYLKKSRILLGTRRCLSLHSAQVQEKKAIYIYGRVVPDRALAGYQADFFCQILDIRQIKNIRQIPNIRQVPGFRQIPDIQQIPDTKKAGYQVQPWFMDNFVNWCLTWRAERSTGTMAWISGFLMTLPICLRAWAPAVCTFTWESPSTSK